MHILISKQRQEYRKRIYGSTVDERNDSSYIIFDVEIHYRIGL